MSEELVGVCVSFNPAKGWGWISPAPDLIMERKLADIWVHYNAIISESKFKTLHVGDVCQFSVNRKPDGRIAATNVRVIQHAAKQPREEQTTSAAPGKR